MLARELDGETIRRARVVVDQPGTVEGAGDIVIPIEDGTIPRGHAVGSFALEDLVAARLAYTRAQARGIGREVRL